MKNPRSRISTATAAVLLVCLSFLPASPATATASEVDQYGELRTHLELFGVPAAQVNSLVAAIQGGEAWDVYETGAKPVKRDRMIINGMDYRINRFADGSFSAQGIEVPTIATSGLIQPFGIQGCVVTGGTGFKNYDNCQIDGVWGAVVAGATGVDFTIVQSGYDRIRFAGVPFQRCLVGTSCSSPSLVSSRFTETASNRAFVRWQGDASTIWGGSWNYWVELRVGRNTFSTVTS